MSKTKIVATFGPASQSPSVIESMVDEGVSCARLNLSHGTKEKHSDLIASLKKIRNDNDLPLSIIADTKGPEVRIRPAEGGDIHLNEDEVVLLTSGRAGEHKSFIADYEDIRGFLDEGYEVIVGDGELSLTVETVSDRGVRCRTMSSGVISGRQRITVPGISFPLPPITEQDKKDIKFAVSEGADWLALSFVKGGEEIKQAKELARDVDDRDVPVIAKIETAESVENIEEIALVADGLMVARGDLAMALGMEEVPFLQKRIIRLANNMAKPVVTATQMLETMIDAPTPTRAEVTDVANAVLDGTDAIMLSGETAIGSYPAKTVSTMRKIARKADDNFSPSNNLTSQLDGKRSETAPEIGRASCTMAERLEAGAIITSTRSGYTARLIARFRPEVQIIAVTPSRSVYNQLALVWGVKPIRMETTRNTDQMIEKSIYSAREEGYVDKGDLVVVTAGVPFSVEGTTNLIKVEQVG
ncbi:MAG: pyruvate kinase [Candidatus Bipolaricaulota bacterium]|nr:pyruvate kinase [Candidatus Bipolaricaulota bacterium]MBS3792959.1 pyruvate kinase [Candidatus Bipolaricaulota bacterium]